MIYIFIKYTFVQVIRYMMIASAGYVFSQVSLSGVVAFSSREERRAGIRRARNNIRARKFRYFSCLVATVAAKARFSAVVQS